MHLSKIIKKTERVLRDNSPAILTALGVTGTCTTAYLSARAGYAHAHKMSEENPQMAKKDHAKLVWKLYIPAAATGVVAIGCIISATKIGSRRTAALTAAYSLSETAFVEYREKVVETLGERKEQKLRDEIAQDRVNDNQPKSVIIVGESEVLCYEHFTGRYFKSDMETLRKAMNDINAQLVRNDYATMTDFYHLAGISWTTHSSDYGWEASKLMELEFSAVLQDGKPCMAIDYNYVKPL